MRIAMIIEAWKPLWGGGQAHVFELAQKLAQNHDCEIDIFTMNLPDDKGESQLSEEMLAKRVRLIRTGKARTFTFSERIFWIPEIVFEVHKRHSKKRYDLVHAHANLPGIPGKILGLRLRIPVIYTAHGDGTSAIFDMYGKNTKSRILLYVENFLHTKIRYNREISVDHLLLKKDNVNTNVAVIPNGVNISDFDSIAPPAKNKAFKILFVGRLHRQKGLSYFLLALQKIKKDLPENTLISLVGDGELRSSLQEKTKKLALENLVRFTGSLYKKELLKEFKSSDLFVLPSLYEGQPLTLLEAWAAKLPVIATRVGDNARFIQEGRNGFIVEPKDSNQLAECILQATRRKDLHQLGENGYELVRRNYTWDDTARKTYAVYLKSLRKNNDSSVASKRKKEANKVHRNTQCF